MVPRSSLELTSLRLNCKKQVEIEMIVKLTEGIRRKTLRSKLVLPRTDYHGGPCCTSLSILSKGSEKRIITSATKSHFGGILV